MCWDKLKEWLIIIFIGILITIGFIMLVKWIGEAVFHFFGLS